MKKIICFMVALILSCSFVLTAGAWNYEDLGTSYVKLDQSNARYVLNQVEYAAGAWPFVIDLSASLSGSNSLYFSGYLDLNTPEMGVYWDEGVLMLAFFFVPTIETNLDVVSSNLTFSFTQGFSSRLDFEYSYDNKIFDIKTQGNPLFSDIEIFELYPGVAYAFGGVPLNEKNILSFSYKLTLSDAEMPADPYLRINYGLENDWITVYGYNDYVSGDPTVDSVTISNASPAPYYPGAEVRLKADVSGTGILPGTLESTVYWYVHGNTSPDTTIDNDGLLTISNDETSTQLEIEAISTYDSTKSSTVSVPVTYPLDLQITPAQTTLITSAKRQEIQFELLLPDGKPFDYSLLEWTTPGAAGQYIRIDDNGLLEVFPGAPAGTVTVKYAYQHDMGNVSTSSATVTITTQQEGIFDQLNPTPEQNDKAEEMEDAIGDAADKLENNNSSLGQLTPTRPQINTNLEFDQEQMLAVSPLVTNIWSINGLGRMISIVLVVATVAYIFFGKRDG